MGRVTKPETLEDSLQKGQCHFIKYQTRSKSSRGLTPRGPTSLQENLNQVQNSQRTDAKLVCDTLGKPPNI
jgi:hypothetical protein